MDEEFGKITKVNIRDYFKSETTEFTPWVIDHIQDISNLLGIDISDLRSEEGVGDFRLDIIGKESRTMLLLPLKINSKKPTTVILDNY